MSSPLLIPSLMIKNFRIFKEFKMERFGRVNLFVGKNSTGKSCLLEAVHLFASGCDPVVLSEMLTGRDENTQSGQNEGVVEFWGFTEHDPFPRDALRHIFHGYTLPDIGETGIVMQFCTEEGRFIRLYQQTYQVAVADGKKLLVPFLGSSTHTDGTEKINKITLGTEGGRLRILTQPRGIRETHPVQDFHVKIQHISSQSIEKLDSPALWDHISLTDMEKEVIDAVNLVQPSVTGIAFIGGHSGRKERYGVVRLEGSNEKIPMKSLGDGVVRVFHMILALVNAKDGILLLDEAENGLHWRILEPLWEIVFRLAEQLNVQVFATTHSLDCTQGFHSAWSKQEDLGGMFRLAKDPEQGVKCVLYPCETLGNALETAVEMR